MSILVNITSGGVATKDGWGYFWRLMMSAVGSLLNCSMHSKANLSFGTRAKAQIDLACHKSHSADIMQHFFEMLHMSQVARFLVLDDNWVELTSKKTTNSGSNGHLDSNSSLSIAFPISISTFLWPMVYNKTHSDTYIKHSSKNITSRNQQWKYIQYTMYGHS